MTASSVVVAVANSAWQGLALVALVALALRLARRPNAATACAVWSAAFFAIAILPVVDLALQRSMVVEVASVAAGGAAHAGNAAGAGQHVPSAPSALAAVQAAARVAAGDLSAVADRLGLALLAFWACVSAVLLTLLARNGYALVRLKRSATPLAVEAIRAIGDRVRGRRVRICASDRIGIPCAAGFLHPMVVVPAALVETLTEDDLTRIVLHEAGHLERFDDWFNALERVLRAIFFFQPALLLAGSRIDFERELACDDRALAAVGEPVRYAECLTRIVERQVGRRSVAANPGFLIGRSQVAARIARLVDRRRNGTVGLARTVAVSFLCVGLAAAGIARVQVPLVARAVHAPTAAFVRSARVAVVDKTSAVLRHRRLAVAAPLPLPPPVLVVAQAAAPKRVDATSVATHVVVRVAARRALRVVTERHETFVAFSSSAKPSERGPAAPGPGDESTSSDASPDSSAAPLPVDSAPRANAELASALAQAGYHASDGQLEELAGNGLTAHFVKAVAGSGIRLPSLQALLGACEKGLDRAFLQAATKRFGTSISLDDLVALRDEGVSSSYLDALAAVGYDHLSVREAVELDQNGVSAEYIAELAAAGYPHFASADLIELRNEGVDGDFLRALAQHGYHGLSTSDIVRQHGEGLEP